MPAKKQGIGIKRPAALPLRRSPRLNKQQKTDGEPADTVVVVAEIPTTTVAIRDAKLETPKFDVDTITKRSIEVFKLLYDLDHDLSTTDLRVAVERMLEDGCPLNCNVYADMVTQPHWLAHWAHLGCHTKMWAPERVTRGFFDLIRAGGGIPHDPLDANSESPYSLELFRYILDIEHLTFIDCLLTLPTADNDTWGYVMCTYMGAFIRDPPVRRESRYDALVAHIITNMSENAFLRELHYSNRICVTVLANGAIRSVRALFARPEYVRIVTPFPNMRSLRNHALVQCQESHERWYGDSDVDDTEYADIVGSKFDEDTDTCEVIVVEAINTYLKSASDQISKTLGTTMPRDLYPLIVGYLLSSSLEWLFPAITPPPFTPAHITLLPDSTSSSSS